jgi:hypothetical protein
MVVDLSFEELDNFPLKRRDESVVATYVIGGSLCRYSPKILVLAG